tara:strand:- start:5287 stop:5865 length:579 start_codon:yes stop_codon:yes gene_type:complete
MNEEKLKRLKIKETEAPTMFVDSEAVALSVIPFLDATDLRHYLAINFRMHHNYDNDILWRKVAKVFFNTDGFWHEYTKRDIKKCVHFKELTYAHTLPRIMEEVTTEYQLNMFKVYVNKCDYSEHTKGIMRIMISLLAPRFLRRPYMFPAQYENLPDIIKKHVRRMYSISMAELGGGILDTPQPWEILGTHML